MINDDPHKNKGEITQNKNNTNKFYTKNQPNYYAQK